MSQSLRECIEGAFRDVGGRDYLARVAKRRPDVFLALLSKIIPQETRTTVLAAYQNMPLGVIVEVRDSITGPQGSLPALPMPVTRAEPVEADF